MDTGLDDQSSVTESDSEDDLEPFHGPSGKSLLQVVGGLHNGVCCQADIYPTGGILTPHQRTGGRSAKGLIYSL